MKSRSLIFAFIAIALALLFGLAMHFLAVLLRDNGPSFDDISFRSNGALIVLPVALLGLILGEIVYVRRRAWPAVIPASIRGLHWLLYHCWIILISLGTCGSCAGHTIQIVGVAKKGNSFCVGLGLEMY